MTGRQKQLVQESLEDLRDLSAPVSLLFYGRLFDLDPALRKLFKADIRDQASKLMSMLALIVESLDHFDELRPQLFEMGRRHAAYGVEAGHYETVAAALVWAIGQALQPDFYPETKAAWLALIDAVSEVMKAGALHPQI